MKAFVMIEIRTGEIQEVVRQVRRLKGVAEAHMTFGPYDAVAVIEASDIKDLGRILATGVQPIPGVLDTMTCLAVDF
jgi:DNA-binding Lrp family transcriptional regulator